MRTYSQLKIYETFEQRFEYLKLNGGVAHDTFGHDRWINQRFYSSREWKQIRTHVIARDLGLDLGVPGHEVVKTIQVHHMNPMTADDILQERFEILDPEFLITVSLDTHNAIHYGQEAPKILQPATRRAGDTTLW